MKKILTVVLALGFLASCSGSSSSSLSRFAVWGKVVDLSTQAGVSGATVKLYVGTAVKSAATAADDPATADYNEAGDFMITEVPDGRHRLRVVQENYAVYEEWLTLEPTGGSAASNDVSYYYAANGNTNGKIMLAKGCNVSAYVTGEGGTVVSGATVYAVRDQADTLYSGTGQAPELTATTDSTGLATIAGLNQALTYDLYVPAYDSDSDGTYNYQTTLIANNYGCDDSDPTVANALTTATRGDAISVIDGSFRSYLDGTELINDDTWGFSPSGAITLVFSYPIALDTDSVGMEYTRDLVLQSDSTTGTVREVALAAALSAGNTILTLTPTSPLTNERYQLQGTVSAMVSGVRTYSTFDNLTYNAIALDSWYSFNTSTFSTASISADNYNGSINGGGGAAAVYLEFPEYVYGRATLMASTTGTGANATTYYTELDANREIDLSWTNDGVEDTGWICDGATDRCLVIDEKGKDGVAGGTDTGCSATSATVSGEVKYIVPLGINLNDNTSGSVNTVTVAIDATDYEGNHVYDELTLPVQ